MPVRQHIDHETRLIVTFVDRDAGIEDIGRAVEEISSEPHISVYNDLTVFEDVNRSVGQLNPSDNSVKRLAGQLSNLYGRTRPFKSAYVVASEVDYGLLRMYTTYRGRDLDRFGLFFRLSEAFVWLAISEDQATRLGLIIDAWRGGG